MVKLIKQILQKWNLELSGYLTDTKSKLDACDAIILTLPSIQFVISQRILSFTNVSPNMMMFRQQLTETTDKQVFKHGFGKS